MTTAGPITPDTKDWTWVLDRPCPECGYDASTVAVADLRQPALRAGRLLVERRDRGARVVVVDRRDLGQVILGGGTDLHALTVPVRSTRQYS